MKDVFPYYWYRLYPFFLILGIASLVYELIPGVNHGRIVDALAGFFIGLAIVGVIFRRSRDRAT